MNHEPVSGTLLCTVSGTALSLAAHIESPEVVKTITLAAIGAMASFGVSLLLKWLALKFRRPSRPNDKPGDRNGPDSRMQR